MDLNKKTNKRGQKTMPGDIANLTFSYILQGIAVLIIIYEIYKKIKEVKNESDAEHEWQMRVKKAVEAMEAKEKLWDEGLRDLDGMRERLSRDFNKRLDDIEAKIEDNHTDTEAKIQEVRAEQMFQMELFKTVLEGLGQLGANGPVTIMSEKLDDYLNKKAHE